MSSQNVDAEIKSRRKPSVRRINSARTLQNKLGAMKLKPAIELKQLGETPCEQIISRSNSESRQSNKGDKNNLEGDNAQFEIQSEVQETEMFAGDAGVDFVQLRQQVSSLATDVSEAASKVLVPTDLNLLEKAQSLINRLGQMTMDMATVIDNRVEGFVNNFSSTLSQPTLHPTGFAQSSLPPKTKLNSRKNNPIKEKLLIEEDWGDILGSNFSLNRENYAPNQKGGQKQNLDQNKAERMLSEQLSLAETDIISLKQKYDTLVEKLHSEQSKVEKLHQENKLLRSESIESQERDIHTKVLNQQVETALQELLQEKAKLAYENERLNRENGQLQELLMYSVHQYSGGITCDAEIEGETVADFEDNPPLLSSREHTVVSEFTTSYDDSGAMFLQDQQSVLDSNIKRNLSTQDLDKNSSNNNKFSSSSLQDLDKNSSNNNNVFSSESIQ